LREFDISFGAVALPLGETDMTLHEPAAPAGKCSQPAAMKSTFPNRKIERCKGVLATRTFQVNSFLPWVKLRGPRAKANGIPDRSSDNKPMRSMSRAACSSKRSRDKALPIAGLSWESLGREYVFVWISLSGCSRSTTEEMYQQHYYTDYQ
jgi:hypothetical protein